jgi:hypothetical protein
MIFFIRKKIAFRNYRLSSQKEYDMNEGSANVAEVQPSNKNKLDSDGEIVDVANNSE